VAEYRLLASSMMVGENRERRAHRGDYVEVEDKERAKVLMDAGLIVKKGDETDEQKREFDSMDREAEVRAADRKEIERQERELVEQGGKAENTTAATKEPIEPRTNQSGAAGGQKTRQRQHPDE
jgi:hypothetical protein